MSKERYEVGEKAIYFNPENFDDDRNGSEVTIVGYGDRTSIKGTRKVPGSHVIRFADGIERTVGPSELSPIN